MAGKGKPGPPKGVRYGGRQKGTPNKSTIGLFERLKAYMSDQHGIEDYDPLIELAELAHTTPEDAIKGKALAEIASYLHPKRKAVELTGADGGPLAIEQRQKFDEEFDAILEKIRAKAAAKKKQQQQP